ncbi:hypothetical protein HQ520_06880 [bacterium]|nr:hypothetical protein [bacterium]
MAELNREQILARVRENKEALAKAQSALDQARGELAGVRAEMDTLRGQCDQMGGEIAEKDQAIQDLIAQNQELQENLSGSENDLVALRREVDEKSGLERELTAILGG